MRRPPIPIDGDRARHAIILLAMRSDLIRRCPTGRVQIFTQYLSVSAAGQRPQLNYVAHGDYDQVAEFVANFRAVRSALNEICAINTELLRRHEDLG